MSLSDLFGWRYAKLLVFFTGSCLDSPAQIPRPLSWLGCMPTSFSWDDVHIFSLQDSTAQIKSTRGHQCRLPPYCARSRPITATLWLYVCAPSASLSASHNPCKKLLNHQKWMWFWSSPPVVVTARLWSHRLYAQWKLKVSLGGRLERELTWNRGRAAPVNAVRHCIQYTLLSSSVITLKFSIDINTRGNTTYPNHWKHGASLKYPASTREHLP